MRQPASEETNAAVCGAKLYVATLEEVNYSRRIRCREDINCAVPITETETLRDSQMRRNHAVGLKIAHESCHFCTLLHVRAAETFEDGLFS